MDMYGRNGLDPRFDLARQRIDALLREAEVERHYRMLRAARHAVSLRWAGG